MTHPSSVNASNAGYLHGSQIQRAGRTSDISQPDTSVKVPVHGNAHPAASGFKSRILGWARWAKKDSNVQKELPITLGREEISSEANSIASDPHSHVRAGIVALCAMLDAYQDAVSKEKDIGKNLEQLKHNTAAALNEVKATGAAFTSQGSQVDTVLQSLYAQDPEQPEIADEILNYKFVKFDLNFRYQVAIQAHTKDCELELGKQKNLDVAKAEKASFIELRDTRFDLLEDAVEHISDQEMDSLILSCGYAKESQSRFLKFVGEELDRHDLTPDNRAKLLHRLIDLPESWLKNRTRAHSLVKNHLNDTTEWSSRQIQNLTVHLQFATARTALGNAVETYGAALSTSAHAHQTNNREKQIQGAKKLLELDRKNLERFNREFDDIVHTRFDTSLVDEDSAALVPELAVDLMCKIIHTRKNIETQEQRLEQDEARLAQEQQGGQSGAASSALISGMEEKIVGTVGGISDLLFEEPNKEWIEQALPLLSGTKPAEAAFVKSVEHQLQKLRMSLPNNSAKVDMKDKSAKVKKLLTLLIEAHTTWSADGAKLAGRALAPYLATRLLKDAADPLIERHRDALSASFGDALARRVDIAVEQVKQDCASFDPLVQQKTHNLARDELSHGAGLEKIKTLVQAFGNSRSRDEFLSIANCFLLKPEKKMTQVVEQLIDAYVSTMPKKKRVAEMQALRHILLPERPDNSLA